MKLGILPLALLAAASGCYVAPDPGGLPADSLIQLVVPSETSIEADGTRVVDITVTVAPTTVQTASIVVETSSGVLSASADPTKPEARRITLSNVGTGRFDLKLRVGNVAGTTLVTASVAGYSVTEAIELDASPAQVIVLSASKSSINADGESKFDVGASLYAAKETQKVSEGARVRFEVCCPDDAGEPVPCSGPTPLVVPAEAQLGAGTQSIPIQAVTERIVATSDTPASIHALLIAEAVRGEGPISLCSPAAPGAVRGELSLSVRPISP